MNTTTHLDIFSVFIFIAVKVIFQGDLGDYFIGIYISILILLTTFRVMNEKLTGKTPSEFRKSVNN